MCGIVGLYLKNPALQGELGRLFTPMLIEMTERGPDSAGVAVYHDPVGDGATKLTLFNRDRDYAWKALETDMERIVMRVISDRTTRVPWYRRETCSVRLLDQYLLYG